MPVSGTIGVGTPPEAYLNPALLYAHETAMPDEVARYLKRGLTLRATGEPYDVSEFRKAFFFPLMWLQAVSPLIEEGAAIAVASDASDWHRVGFPRHGKAGGFTTSELRAIAELRKVTARRTAEGDILWHMGAISQLLFETRGSSLGALDEVANDSMDAIFMFQHGMADLQFRAEALARAFPLSDKDWRFFRLLADENKLTSDTIDVSVANGLATLELPSFARPNRHTRELLVARWQEEAFEAWRSGLRRAIRTVEGLSPSAVFRMEAKAALEDELVPLAVAVRRAVDRSAVLREAATESALALSISAGVVTATGLIANVDPMSAVAGLSVGALGRVAAAWLLAGRKLSDEDRFVSAFLSARAVGEAKRRH